MPSTTIETNAAQTPLELFGQGSYPVIVGGSVKNGFACSKGDVLGKITSGGQLRRRSRSTVGATAFATNSAAGSVGDGTLFKPGDVLTKSDGTVVGTILSVSGNNVTLTGNAAVALATGQPVLASDGSQVAAGIADLGSDGVGDTSVPVFIGGYLNESLINGLDATAKTELGGRSALGGVFKF